MHNKKHKMFYRQKYHEIFAPEKIKERPYARYYIEEMKDVIEAIGANENDIILDVGCGYGRLTLPLASKNSCLVVGIDISSYMIRKAKESAKKDGINNLGLIIGDAERLPLKERSVNYAISLDITPHLKDPISHLRELKRVVANNGLILIDFSNKNFFWMLAHPTLFIQKLLHSIRKKELAKFIENGGIPNRITHYSQKEIKKLLKMTNLNTIRWTKYGLSFAPKFLLLYLHA